ncbi:hypothetical protein R6Z07M_010118 [Ovis aries]
MRASPRVFRGAGTGWGRGSGGSARGADPHGEKGCGGEQAGGQGQPSRPGPAGGRRLPPPFPSCPDGRPAIQRQGPPAHEKSALCLRSHRALVDLSSAPVASTPGPAPSTPDPGQSCCGPWDPPTQQLPLWFRQPDPLCPAPALSRRGPARVAPTPQDTPSCGGTSAYLPRGRPAAVWSGPDPRGAVRRLGAARASGAAGRVSRLRWWRWAQLEPGHRSQMLRSGNRRRANGAEGRFWRLPRAGPRAASPPGRPPPLLLLLLLYHNALGLAFTLLKEHEYIIIHTKEQAQTVRLQRDPEGDGAAACRPGHTSGRSPACGSPGASPGAGAHPPGASSSQRGPGTTVPPPSAQEPEAGVRLL